MSRRLSPHRFRQALKACLPVQRRASRPRTAEACVWIFTFDNGRCISRELLPAAEVAALTGEIFSFTGHERECETDLQYHGVRTFDPSVGRWLSEEPLRFAAGDPNLHRYVATPPKNQGEDG